MCVGEKKNREGQITVQSVRGGTLPVESAECSRSDNGLHQSF